MSGWDTSDLTFPEVPAVAEASDQRRFALTVLYHPDFTRIGECAQFGRSRRDWPVFLSRLEPLFSQPRGPVQQRPLEDRYLSRSPARISWKNGGLMLQPPASGASLKVDGETLRGSLAVNAAALESGVVLALANRVLLLLHESSTESNADEDCGLVGEHAQLQRVRKLIGRVAPRDTPVLLLGESGTGKELVAQAIHRRSSRRDGKLIALNMAAIPEDLAAAELFGVSRGAYTGADSDRAGYFREAEGGTLFLDEIGACAASVQAQLLRALQQGEIQVPGGGARRVDVRVMAATDADLDDKFSTALRYRLGGFEIHLPPLRNRREDLGRLLAHFLPAERLSAAAKDPREVARWVELIADMTRYRWPGNVRELANFCQQIDIASSSGRLQVPGNIERALSGGVDAGLPPRQTGAEPPTDQQVRDAMMAARWEVSRAARELRISRQALYRRIEDIPDLRTAADIPGAEVESAFYECRGDLEQAALRLQVSTAALRRRWRAMDLASGGW